MRLSKPLLLKCPPDNLHEVPLLQTECVVGDRVLVGICECPMAKSLKSDNGSRTSMPSFPG